MSTAPITDPIHVWTLEDLDQLPDELQRCYEIVDGSLVVTPMAHPFHELILARLLRAVAPQVPDGYELVGALRVNLKPSYLVTDLTVVRSSLLTPAAEVLVDPADILLAVETVSPSSRTMDRVVKPAKYAAAGVPAYWRLETNPVSLTAYALPRGADVYAEVGSWQAGEIARIEAPFPVEIEISALG